MLLCRELLAPLYDEVLNAEHVVPDTLQWAKKLLLLIIANPARLGFNPVAEYFESLHGGS